MKQEINLTNKTFSGTLYLLTSSGIQAFLKIGVLAILARLISPKDFGVVGIAVVIVEFSKLFSQMGVGPCLVQIKKLEQRHLTTGFSLSLIIGLFFALLLVLAAPLFQTFFRMEGLSSVLMAIAVVFLVNSVTITGQALMQRNMQFRTIALVEVISYAIGYGAVSIVLGYLGWGLWALVIAIISQAFLNAVLIMVVQPFTKKIGFERKALKELVHYAVGFTIARIANFMALQGDNLVVGRTLGAVSLGIYGRAYQFMVMPSSLFGNALDRTLFPAMARVQDDKPKLLKAYLTGTSLIALVAIPISVVFIQLAPEIIHVLLGKNWSAVILPFRILAFSLLFRMSYKMCDSLARATSAVYKRAWRQMIYAAAVFGSSYIGHFWGLSGVAYGVAVSVVINFFMMSELSMQLTGATVKDLLKAHWHGLLLGALTGLFTFLALVICRDIHLSNLLTIAATLMVVIALVVCVVWMVPGLFFREDHKQLMHKLVPKKFKKPLLQAA